MNSDQVTALIWSFIGLEGFVLGALNARTAWRFYQSEFSDGFGTTLLFRDWAVEFSRMVGILAGVVIGVIGFFDAAHPAVTEQNPNLSQELIVPALFIIYLSLIANANIMYFSNNRLAAKEVKAKNGTPE